MTEKPYRGPLTITVPGLIDLWTWTNQNYGSQNLSLLLDTAMTLARDGFYVQEPLARAVQSSKGRLASYGGWRETFSWMEAGSKARFSRLAEMYAGTEMYERRKGNGIRILNKDSAKYNRYYPVFETDALSQDMLLDMWFKTFLEFNYPNIKMSLLLPRNAGVNNYIDT